MRRDQPEPSPMRGLIEPIERLLVGLSSWSHRHPVVVLTFALVLTALAGLRARSLSIDTDLTHLLPSRFESVQALERFQAQSFGVGYVSVVVQGGSADARRRLAEDLAPKLTELPSIEYVDLRRPTGFFADRALQYLEIEDLAKIHERLEERREWEVRHNSPLYDLGLEPLGEPPPLAFDDVEAKYRKLADRAGARAQTEDEADGYFESAEEGLLVLLARPGRRSSDVSFNDRVVEEVRRVVEAADPSAYDPGISLALSGRYKKKADQKAQIERDLGRASSVALVLMLAYLALHFRRLSAVLLVLTPLAAGIVWAFGAAALLFGSLNLLTGFIGAVLLGIGIDHGIHLVARMQEETAALGADPSGEARRAAVERAFGETGRAVVAAGLTTIFAFAGVAISEFRAFREFGVIAALGLTFIVFSYTTILPALLRFAPSGRPPAPTPRSPFAEALPRWAPATGWLAGLAFVAVVPFVAQNEFDYDFASLEDSNLPAFRLDRRVNALLGRSQTPLVALADGPEHERAIVTALRRRIEELGARSPIQQVLSLDDLVPEQSADKAELIAAIGRSLRDIHPKWLEEKQREQRERLIAMTDFPAFDRADLPIEVRRQLVGRKGDGTFVLIYPSVSLSDGQSVRRLAEELRAIRLPDGRSLEVAGEAMVLADVLDMVVEETPWVVAFTLGLVVLVLLVLLGVKLVAPCTLAALATLLATAGLMPLVGVRFNYLDIVMVPVVFGMSVDGAVHVLVRHQSLGDVVAVVTETGRAIAGAVLTTMLGFGAFALAHHPGLQSLGQVALLGLAVNLLICLVALPSLMLLVQRVKRLRDEGGFDRLLTRLAVTVGLAGDAPVAPGTLGALIAVPFSLLAQRLGPLVSAVMAGALTALSIGVTGRYLRQSRTKDPNEVVLDELVGCLIAMAMVPQGAAWAIAAFLLFRFLDIVKPWPISVVERRAKGAWGVIGDDVAAGLVAGLLLAIVHHAGLTRGWWT